MSAEAPDTRTRLLQAAVAAIEAGGERAVKVRDVAAVAGVTEPSVYHFFGNREGLIEEAQVARYVLDQRWSANAFADAVYQCRTKREYVATVKAQVRGVLRADRIAMRTTRVNVVGSAQHRPSLAARVAVEQVKLNAAFADALNFAQKKGWCPASLDTNAAVAWVVGTVTGRILIEVGTDDPSWDAWDDICVDAIVSIVVAPPR
jgi:AcrR family transcriptional regulator